MTRKLIQPEDGRKYIDVSNVFANACIARNSLKTLNWQPTACGKYVEAESGPLKYIVRKGTTPRAPTPRDVMVLLAIRAFSKRGDTPPNTAEFKLKDLADWLRLKSGPHCYPGLKAALDLWQHLSLELPDGDVAVSVPPPIQRCTRQGNVYRVRLNADAVQTLFPAAVPGQPNSLARLYTDELTLQDAHYAFAFNLSILAQAWRDRRQPKKGKKAKADQPATRAFTWRLAAFRNKLQLSDSPSKAWGQLQNAAAVVDGLTVALTSSKPAPDTTVVWQVKPECELQP